MNSVTNERLENITSNKVIVDIAEIQWMARELLSLRTGGGDEEVEKIVIDPEEKTVLDLMRAGF